MNLCTVSRITERRDEISHLFVCQLNGNRKECRLELMFERKVYYITRIRAEIVKGVSCVKLNFKFICFWHFIKGIICLCAAREQLLLTENHNEKTGNSYVVIHIKLVVYCRFSVSTIFPLLRIVVKSLMV